MIQALIIDDPAIGHTSFANTLDFDGFDVGDGVDLNVLAIGLGAGHIGPFESKGGGYWPMPKAGKPSGQHQVEEKPQGSVRHA